MHPGFGLSNSANWAGGRRGALLIFVHYRGGSGLAQVLIFILISNRCISLEQAAVAAFSVFVAVP
jgi:hypothetical protein